MEKPARPIRNRRHNRRVWPPGDTHRPVKRLFTPEIKRMLKDWLVRRRDNPYPSRDEKKTLAYETGLTYTQICNWFANWRRKLKNSGKEPTKKTWGHLIKNYNVNAKGNVEQFSICSNDSIWGDAERSSNESNSPIYSQHDNYEDNNNNNVQKLNNDFITFNMSSENQEYHYNIRNQNYKNFILNNNNNFCYENQNESAIDHYYTSRTITQPQCFQVSSTTLDDQNSAIIAASNNENKMYKNQNYAYPTNNAKYKHQMMEKYLRDNNNCKALSNCSTSSSSNSPELSKWLESAANFTPNKNNYYIEWNSTNAKNNCINKSERKQHLKSTVTATDLPNCLNFYSNPGHQKEELDAAEALANLACNFRQRMVNTGNYLSSY